MPLQRSLLKKAKQHGDKLVAQCPACAEMGGDSKGVHLVIYPDERFGCVAYPKDKAHRRRIAELVGDKRYPTKSWQLMRKSKDAPRHPSSNSAGALVQPQSCYGPIPSLTVEAIQIARATAKQPSEASESVIVDAVSDASDASFPYPYKEIEGVPVQGDSLLYAGYGETTSDPSDDIVQRAAAMFSGKVRHFAPSTPLPPSLAGVLRDWKHRPTSVLLPPAGPRLLGWSRKGKPIYARDEEPKQPEKLSQKSR